MKKRCITNNFPRNLRDLRLQFGLSQTGLGESLRYGQNHISYWERGKNFPGIQTLLNISEFFDVSLDSLLFYPGTGYQAYCNPICLSFKQLTRAEAQMDLPETIRWRRLRAQLIQIALIKDDFQRNRYLALLEPIVDDIYKIALKELVSDRFVDLAEENGGGGV